MRAKVWLPVAAAAVVAFLWFGTLGRVLLIGGVVLVTAIVLPVVLLRGWRRVAGALVALVAVLAMAVGLVKLRYGGGSPYRDTTTTPMLPATALEPMLTLDYPLGNVAASRDGRIFFNYHPFAKAERFTPATVFEVVDGTPRPYPDEAFQSRYQGVFGMTVDHQQRLWFIEPAGLDHPKTRLLGFDLATNKLAFEFWFPEGVAKFAQDLRVAPDGQTIYLADTGFLDFTKASLIVFDVGSKTYRVLLSDLAAAQHQDWVITTKYGPHKLAYGLVTFVVGLDGIELSADGRWLYFAAMSHDRLYRVPTQVLLDPDASDIGRRVEDLGPKPLSDGITIDRDGAVLLTDIEHGAIARLDANGKLSTLARAPQVTWADGIVVAPDGSILLTDSAIPAYIDQLGRPPSKERLAGARPYHLFRIKRP